MSKYVVTKDKIGAIKKCLNDKNSMVTVTYCGDTYKIVSICEVTGLSLKLVTRKTEHSKDMMDNHWLGIHSAVNCPITIHGHKSKSTWIYSHI